MLARGHQAHRRSACLLVGLCWTTVQLLQASGARLDYTGDDGAPAVEIVEVLHETNGATAHAVVDKGNYRFLTAGRSVIGAAWTPAPSNVGLEDEFAFAGWALQALALYASCPKFSRYALDGGLALPCASPQRALCLGLGSGSVASYFSRRGVRVDVVENSRSVIQLARRHFGLSILQAGSMSVFHSDASKWIDRTAPPADGYDFILHDLFTAGENSLLKRDFMERLARDWLSDRGVLAVNFLGASPGNGKALMPIHRFTLRTVEMLRSIFNEVRCFRDLPLDFMPKKVTNICCLGTNKEGGLSFLLPDPVVDADAEMFPTSHSLQNMPRYEVFTSASQQHSPCLVLRGYSVHGDLPGDKCVFSGWRQQSMMRKSRESALSARENHAAAEHVLAASTSHALELLPPHVFEAIDAVARRGEL